MHSLVPHLRATRHSQTLLVNQLSQQLADNGHQVFKFGFGQSPFPVPNEIRQALADAAHRKEYMSVEGHPPLREAIASFHNHMENKNWRADQIIVGSGSKILIYCLMAAIQQAELLLPAPGWVSYEPQGRLAGHKISWIDTDFDNQWRLTPGQLEQFCRSRSDPSIPLILIFNYPSNPSGQTYSAGQLRALAEVMRKYNIVVVADEIYSLLSFEPEHATLEDFYPEGCIVSSSLSKWCGAGGWRLGFVHIPEQLGHEFFQAVIGVASETYSCAASPIQVAATRAYENHSLAKEFLNRQIELLSEINLYCSGTLRQAGVDVHAAQGGFYLFPEFDAFKSRMSDRGIRTSEQLTTALMSDTGVALLPGSAFGMPEESLTARLAFVDFDGDQILNTEVGTLEFSKVKQGIAEISNWLHKL